MPKKLILYVLGTIIFIVIGFLVYWNFPIQTTRKSDTLIEESQILFIRPSEEKFESLKDEDGIYEVDSDFGFGIQQTIDSLDLQGKYKHLKYEVVTDRFIEIKDCKNGPIKIYTDTLLYTTILTSPEKEIKVIRMVNSMGYLSAIDDFFDIKWFFKDISPNKNPDRVWNSVGVLQFIRITYFFKTSQVLKTCEVCFFYKSKPKSVR